MTEKIGVSNEIGRLAAGAWLRIAIVAGSFVIAACLAQRTSEINRSPLPLAVATARVVGTVLAWVGMIPHRELATLTDPGGFGYEIDFACTGIIPAGLLAAAILASKTQLRAKLLGLIIGIPSTLALNIVRLVHLFYIGVRHPRFFRWAHSPLWEGLTIAFVVGLYLLWRRSAADISEDSRQAAKTP